MTGHDLDTCFAQLRGELAKLAPLSSSFRPALIEPLLWEGYKLSPATYQELWLPYLEALFIEDGPPSLELYTFEELERWHTLMPFAELSLELESSSYDGELLSIIFASPALTSLNHITMSEVYLDNLAVDALVGSPFLGNLRSLWLDQSGLPTEELQRLSSAPFLEGLTNLGLTHMETLDEGLLAFLEGLKLPQLEVLDLSGNGIRDAGACYLTASHHWPHLRGLGFGHNRIGLEGLEALFTSEALAGLESLSLYNNSFGDEGARLIAERCALPQLKTLSVWTYDWIPSSPQITDEGYLALIHSKRLSAEIRSGFVEKLSPHALQTLTEAFKLPKCNRHSEHPLAQEKELIKQHIIGSAA